MKRGSVLLLQYTVPRRSQLHELIVEGVSIVVASSEVGNLEGVENGLG
jgi:hypothetical protein